MLRKVLFLTACTLAALAVTAQTARVYSADDQKPKAKKAAGNIAPDILKKMTANMPDKAPATPAKPRKLLVFCRPQGFVHDSIPVANKCFELMGEKTGAFEATVSDDLSSFEADNLKQYDAVMMNNTTGPIFGKAKDAKGTELLKNLTDFVASGKGICGVHSASDWRDWPEYGKMIGAQFKEHPWGRIVIKDEDPTNPVSAAFDGKDFPFDDEIYIYQPTYDRKDKHVLLSIDLEKSKITDTKKRPDHDYWVSWIKPYGQGRVYYCSLGHNQRTYTDPTVLKYYLAGIQYALGDLKADDKPKD